MKRANHEGPHRSVDRMLLRLNLEKHGCEEVIEAHDGGEGYELAWNE